MPIYAIIIYLYVNNYDIYIFVYLSLIYAANGTCRNYFYVVSFMKFV